MSTRHPSASGDAARRSNTPGWFWAAGTSNARTAFPWKGSGTGVDDREVIMPYPLAVRPAAARGHLLAGGVR